MDAAVSAVRVTAGPGCVRRMPRRGRAGLPPAASVGVSDGGANRCRRPSDPRRVVTAATAVRGTPRNARARLAVAAVMLASKVKESGSLLPVTAG